MEFYCCCIQCVGLVTQKDFKDIMGLWENDQVCKWGGCRLMAGLQKCWWQLCVTAVRFEHLCLEDVTKILTLSTTSLKPYKSHIFIQGHCIRLVPMSKIFNKYTLPFVIFLANCSQSNPKRRKFKQICIFAWFDEYWFKILNFEHRNNASVKMSVTIQSFHYSIN